MTIRSWIRDLFARTARPRSRTSPRMARGRKTLTLETLEDRTVLSGTPSATLTLLPPADGQGAAAVILPVDTYCPVKS
jgi:hypothetical protein